MYFTFRYAKIAQEESGTINCGHGANGSSLNSQNSCFIPPTIVTNLPKGARCLREEIFDPFLCISKFSGISLWSHDVRTQTQTNQDRYLD